MNKIKLIVGLGNFGTEYINTRHNVGMWFVDALASMENTSFKEIKKFFAEVTNYRFNEESVYLIKPLTYMNNSGKAVVSIASFYKIKPEEILVVHDDLDLDCGRVKFKLGGGNGGHRGLNDIELCIGTSNFYRLRIGIGHPGIKSKVVSYVLHPPTTSENELINDALDKSLNIINEIINGDIDKVIRVLHKA